MKIFITNRDYLTWPAKMAEIWSEQGHDVIFFDNFSTYEPLLDWYQNCHYEVIYAKNNHGASGLWQERIVTVLTEPFVVTDPDYDISMIPADWPEVLLEGLQRFPKQPKIGFSWDESRVPPENPAYILDNMYKYPEGNPLAWGGKLPNNFYGYPCDTSFAVYRPGKKLGINGIRKGRPYTGLHLPWHVVLEEGPDDGKLRILMNDEIAYYFSHAGIQSGTRTRLSDMVTEYYRRKDEKNI